MSAMKVRYLTERELEDAMIAIFSEVDVRGRAIPPTWLGRLALVDGRWRMNLPSHEGWFL